MPPINYSGVVLFLRVCGELAVAIRIETAAILRFVFFLVCVILCVIFLFCVFVYFDVVWVCVFVLRIDGCFFTCFSDIHD